MSRRIRVLLPAALLVLTGCAAHTVPRVEGEAGTLPAARRLIERRDFTAAVELLRGYVDRSTGRGDVDQALYLLGTAHLGAREPALAQIELERLLRDYPESDSGAAASFQLGVALEAQSRSEDFDQEHTVRALEQFERYRREHPGHARNQDAAQHVARLRARLARKLLNAGELYVRLREGGAARRYFERVRDDYADTPVLGRALIGLAWCDALAGDKPAALARLRELEQAHAGQPLAREAADARRRIGRLRVEPSSGASGAREIAEKP